MITIFTSCS